MTTTARGLTGRTVLFGLIGFFGFAFAANAVFVWLAATSWSGLSTQDAYRKGLDYNAVLARAEAQRALGWQATSGFVAGNGNTGRLSVTLKTAAGRPIEGHAVTAAFRRPVVEGLDFTVSLAGTGDGVYSADIGFPAPGQWDVRIEVARPGAQAYLLDTRLWLK
jgi:nitrogen fixation protein FixH